MPGPPFVTPSELAKIRDRHPHIEQDALPTIPPEEGDVEEESDQ